MPPRYQPTQVTIQRPLQNEILTLNKLLGTDILEQAARILDYFAATKESKLEAVSLQTPPQLHDKLLEKCEDFETVCDQIYFILEQSKRVLQLEYQQKMIQVKAANLEKEKLLAEKSVEDEQQLQQQQQQQQQTELMDTDMDFESSQMDVSSSSAMDDTTMTEANNKSTADNNNESRLNTDTMDEEDMEELLQIQRDRLDRLKKVIVFGMDADAVKANGDNGDKEDLLF